MNSRTELLTWVNQVHNAVCRQLGKPPVPRDQIDERYLRRGQTKWLYYWWRFMFAVSYAYPDRPKMDDIYHYQRFILALQYVLPRKADRDRYMTILSANPINRYLITPKYLNRWLIAVHNQFVAKQQINSEKQAYQVYFDRPDNQLQDPAKPAIIDTFIAGGKDTLFIAAGILTILSLLIGSHKSLT